MPAVVLIRTTRTGIPRMCVVRPLCEYQPPRLQDGEPPRLASMSVAMEKTEIEPGACLQGWMRITPRATFWGCAYSAQSRRGAGVKLNEKNTAGAPRNIPNSSQIQWGVLVATCYAYQSRAR
jgi:hypothetical protein